jgi:hypothetical protein
VRERFFSPRLRVKSYEELNAWLLDQCIAYAKAHRHPELRNRTVWEVFEAERSSLVPYAGRFDDFHSADVILNTLARRREPSVPPLTIVTPEALRLRVDPAADCSRDDRLRRAV